MSKFFRVIFIVILLGAAFSASLFMVLESAAFFGRFYPVEKINFGLWAAGLNELFLIIMAAIWLPAIDRGSKKILHPGNFLIKFLLIFLFLNTVGGASLNVIQSKLEQLQEQENRIKILKIRQSQVEDHQNNLDTFVEQKQRLNTVLSTREIQSIKEELIRLQAKQQSSFSLWLDIILSTILRFTIQLANVTTVWLASWLYRQPLKGSGTFHSARKEKEFALISTAINPQQLDKAPRGIQNSPSTPQKDVKLDTLDSPHHTFKKKTKENRIEKVLQASKNSQKGDERKAMSAPKKLRQQTSVQGTKLKLEETIKNEIPPKNKKRLLPISEITIAKKQNPDDQEQPLNGNATQALAQKFVPAVHQKGEEPLEKIVGSSASLLELNKQAEKYREKIQMIVSFRNSESSLNDWLILAGISPRNYKILIEKNETFTEEDVRDLRHIQKKLERIYNSSF